MPEIIIDVTGFPLEYAVVKADGTNTELLGRCTLESVGALVPQLCFSQNIDNVHLYGPGVLVAQIKNEILANVEFGFNNKIKIEVN